MRNYTGMICWQASGFKSITFGKVLEQKLEKNGWLMLRVEWENSKSITWEKVANLSFNLDLKPNQN